MKPTYLHLLALALAFTANAADDKKAADPAVEAAMQKVNATGASLMPTAADGKTYRFTALNVAKEFSDAGLDALAPIANKIASLDLARSKVTDAGLAKVAAMKNLQELHLENTATSDAGLDHLKGLASLEYLNLYNTKVTDAGLPKLAGLTQLKALYLWQSGVTKAGVAALKSKLPQAHINNGWTAEDDAKPNNREEPEWEYRREEQQVWSTSTHRYAEQHPCTDHNEGTKPGNARLHQRATDGDGEERRRCSEDVANGAIALAVIEERMRWAFKCGAHNLEDGLADHHKPNRRNVQRATNAEDGEKEPEKCEWPND